MNKYRRERKKKKCIRWDSNPRQQSWLRPERSALTARPRMHDLLARSTWSFTNNINKKRSERQEQGKKNGHKGAWTLDQWLIRPTLYRLSYATGCDHDTIWLKINSERTKRMMRNHNHTTNDEKKIHPVRFELTPSNEDQNLSLAP